MIIKKDKEFNDFSCHYYIINNSGLYKCSSACWSDIKNYIYKDYIYIDHKSIIKTKYLKRLVNLINNITECKLVNINNKNLIKYKIFNQNLSQNCCYKTNLVLLNFIRTLWHKPSGFNNKKFYKSIMKNLKRQESLYFLMECLKNSVIKLNNRNSMYGDHSNIYPNIIPKHKNKLINKKWLSCKKFMISK